MSSVAIVTDTTTYVPGELLDELGVAQVSLYVGWAGDLQPESSYTDLGAFYARLRDADTLPTTSQPSVGDFNAVYEPLLAAGREVVSIHLARSLSGTCASAEESAAAHDRVTVVDGRTGSGGLGLVVIAAARAAAAGATVAEVLETIDRTRERLAMWFALDTLEYLRRGGRIGAAQAMLGSALRLKPILTFGSEIAPVGRARTRRRAMERMVAYLHELADAGAQEWIVQYAQLPEQAQELAAQGTEILGGPPLFCTQVGPVLGAHLGSGVLVGGIRAGS